MNKPWTSESSTTVRQYLSQHCSARGCNEATLLSELNLDSLELIECLFELEQEYGKTLTNEELGSLKTIEDVVRAFGIRAAQGEEESDEH